jgi:hypothetical protein
MNRKRINQQFSLYIVAFVSSLADLFLTIDVRRRDVTFHCGIQLMRIIMYTLWLTFAVVITSSLFFMADVALLLFSWSHDASTNIGLGFVHKQNPGRNGRKHCLDCGDLVRVLF